MKGLLIALLLFATPCLAIEADKQLHFAGGFTAGAISNAYMQDQNANHRILWSTVAAASIGAGKEVLDMTSGGTPEWADFGYTVAGGLIGALTSELIGYSVNLSATDETASFSITGHF